MCGHNALTHHEDHTDTMTGSKHPANPPTIDLLDSDNDNNLQLTIFEFGSNSSFFYILIPWPTDISAAFKHLKPSNNSPDAASPVAEGDDELSSHSNL